jgi:integrase
MPAEQQGSVYKTKTGYGLRYFDEHGARQRKAGFSSPSKARKWFRDVELPRQRGDIVAPAAITLRQLADEFLEQHVAEPNTVATLKHRLKLAVDGIPVEPRSPDREHALGDVRLDRLDARTVAAWRKRLPEGSAWHVHKALRQLLGYAQRSKLVAENVAQQVPNPQPKRREVPIFAGWEELERVAEELPPERRLLPILVAGTGMRPEEWLALTRADIDVKNRVVQVRRVFTDGMTKEFGKQQRSLRRIPLRQRVVDALDAHPWRIDSPLVFPGPRGHLDLHAWRRDEWYPALESAGLPKRSPYSMRHTFASFAIAAGVSLFYLSRLLGSSVQQVDSTYGHLLPDSEEFLRGLLDAFDSDRSGQEVATN